MRTTNPQFALSRHEPVLELLGGLLGERAEEDRLGGDAVERDHVHDTPQEDTRLARPRTGDEKERAVEVLDSCPLAIVGGEADA